MILQAFYEPSTTEGVGSQHQRLQYTLFLPYLVI